MKRDKRKQIPRTRTPSEMLRAAHLKFRPGDTKRCDANRHRACEKRKPARKNTRDRSHLPGLTGRETRLLKRLADGWQLAVERGLRLIRGKVLGAKARWADVKALAARGLITLRHGLTIAGKALVDHCSGPDPDVPVIAPTKRVVLVERDIRHDPPTLRREAGATLAASLKARGAI